jgi:hypothetical protein
MLISKRCRPKPSIEETITTSDQGGGTEKEPGRVDPRLIGSVRDAGDYIKGSNDMKPQPEPSNQEVLAGLIERVTYHNAENGFCVLRANARGHRDVVTVVGHAATIALFAFILAGAAFTATVGADELQSFVSICLFVPLPAR